MNYIGYIITTRWYIVTEYVFYLGAVNEKQPVVLLAF
jgi:hypothetical protein